MIPTEKGPVTGDYRDRLLKMTDEYRDHLLRADAARRAAEERQSAELARIGADRTARAISLLSELAGLLSELAVQAREQDEEETEIELCSMRGRVVDFARMLSEEKKVDYGAFDPLPMNRSETERREVPEQAPERLRQAALPPVPAHGRAPLYEATFGSGRTVCPNGGTCRYHCLHYCWTRLNWRPLSPESRTSLEDGRPVLKSEPMYHGTESP